MYTLDEYEVEIFFKIANFAILVEAIKTGRKLREIKSLERYTISGLLIGYTNGNSYRQYFYTVPVKQLSRVDMVEFVNRSKALMEEDESINAPNFLYCQGLAIELSKRFEVEVRKLSRFKNKEQVFPVIASIDETVNDFLLKHGQDEYTSFMAALFNTDWNCYEISEGTMSKRTIHFKNHSERYGIEMELVSSEIISSNIKVQRIFKSLSGCCSFNLISNEFLAHFINDDNSNDLPIEQSVSISIPLNSEIKSLKSLSNEHGGDLLDKKPSIVISAKITRATKIGDNLTITENSVVLEKISKSDEYNPHWSVKI